MKHPQIYLERLMPVDVTENYVNWLNDTDINRYLESRFVKHDIESVKLYVEAMTISDNNFLFCKSFTVNLSIFFLIKS